MTLSEAIGVLRRLWFVVLAVALLGAGAGLLAFSNQSTTYRSSVDLVLTPNVATGDSKDVSNALVALDRRTLIGTLAVVAGSDQIQSASIEEAGVPAGEITTFGGTAVADANVVTFSISGTTSASVEAVTQDAVAAIIARFQNQYPIYSVEAIDAPKAVVVRGAPLWQLLAAGLIIGTLVGALIALFIDAAQRSRLDRDPVVPMGYVAVPVQFVQPAAVTGPAPTTEVVRDRDPGPVAERAQELGLDLDLDLDDLDDLDLDATPAPAGDDAPGADDGTEPVAVGSGEHRNGRAPLPSRSRP